ncbi:hypothetical protein, conserved [Babesia ovata]|uniref:Uncharacterized protein n=1 Tax=Babesia ovata TaxID=189622 RepID=A0A2H6KHC0_9APIC|nr:uncharacterized protein BOVATA_038760 [Babesia ovata]GBE62383.1 hypothetical protein, conserved [Babesia ovata]
MMDQSKYGDYVVDKSFKFSDVDEPKLKGYSLGAELDILLSSIKLRDTDEGLYNKLMVEKQRKEPVFPACDTSEAPHLLWLIGFPTGRYINDNEALRRQMAGVRGMRTRINRVGMLKEASLSRKDIKEDTEGDSLRLDQVKKALIEDLEQSYKNECDRMYFNKTQVLPSPSNRPRVRNSLLKGIISKLLELKQTKNPAILLRKPTRDDTEAGHHYAFYHWNFEDVIESMVLFNVGELTSNVTFLQDMYMDYNREILIESVKNGAPFNPITFNILRPEWKVPRDYLWPERLWGLPLGLWLEKFRTGDIDAKQHWVRRDVLDYLQFDWGDGLKYLTFTWDKLVLGLLWYINFRGHPIMDMDPHLVISNAELVAKWGKPEEIQGLKLGYIFYSAMDQIQVLKKHHPERYEFLTEMGISHIWHEDFDLGYRSTPHEKSAPMSRHIKMSKDSKYLRD